MSDARQALSALYASTNGASWRQRGRWLTAKSVCKWHGIECDRSGDVTSIDLGGNNARGTLPSSLSNLSKLRTLNIDESQLSGTLPSLSNLVELRTILLANNPKISGTLPADLFRRLPSLTELDLSRTRLSGSITNSLTGARSLQRLQLDHTSISGTLPTTIGLLTTLEAAFAHESPRLSGTLPTELGRLTALRHGMSFAGTSISGSMPSELGSLTRLRALWLNNMRLSGSLPSDLKRMGGLAELEVHRNALSGSLPALGVVTLGTSKSPLGKALKRCVLTAAQGPHQPLHSMRPVDRVQEDTNRFDCPLPVFPQLPQPCVAHLACSEPLARGRGKRRGWRGRALAERERKSEDKERALFFLRSRLHEVSSSTAINADPHAGGEWIRRAMATAENVTETKKRALKYLLSRVEEL